MSLNEKEELALAMELSARAERERIEALNSDDEVLDRVLKESLREAEAKSASSIPSANAQRQEDEGLFRREADHNSGRSTSMTRSNDNARSRTSDDLPRYDDVVPRNNKGTWIDSILHYAP
jgi:hypothetical protein